MIFYIFCILSVYMYSPLNLFGYWTLNKHYYYYYYLADPTATVLFTVCSAVTVECCVLFPCCVGAFGMFAVM